MPQISNTKNTHAKPRLAATTLLILERSDQECQIFILKRQNNGGFLKDAWIFPGGVVEECDYKNEADPLLSAAVREVAEETGLLIHHNDLQHFSWWLTPKSEAKRFDTHFYVAPYPQSQEPVINPAEAQWGRLLAPSEILALHKAREARLMPPTLLTLESIAGLRTIREIMSKASAVAAPICPELVAVTGQTPALTLPPGLGFKRTRFEISEDGWFS